MTSQEAMKVRLLPNQIAVNVAALGAAPDWQVQDKPADWDTAGDPNHAMYADKLFGYDVPEFMAKQYKRRP